MATSSCHNIFLIAFTEKITEAELSDKIIRR